MAITSNFANLTTTTRASKAWDLGAWDFVSGSTVGDLVEYAANTARITSSGLLVEEATTNEIRNPRAEGGSGATPPTNWTNIGTGGLTRAYTVGQEDGYDYVDIAYSGTQSSASVLGFETSTQIAALTGEDWTTSVGLKIVAGSYSGSILLYHYETTSGGSVVTSRTSSALSVDATHKRFFFADTLAGGGTTASLWPGIGLSGSGVVSFTLRVYIGQCENKAYPTSIALPDVSSPAASTRAADDITVAVGAWFNTSTGTMLIDATNNSFAGSASQSAFTIDDGTTNNRIHLYLSASALATFYVADGAAVQVNNSMSATQVAATSYKAALAWAANDWAMSATGSTQEFDAVGTVPTGLTALRLGSWSSAAQEFNGYISDVRYWPRRLTNAELDAMVGN